MIKNIFATIGVLVCAKYAWEMMEKVIEYKAQERAEELVRAARQTA
ncbi:hypothetical protein LUCX_202 [Xanthomonas phage vB_XciM_LucasX]|nr:hypothetical protein LUCX_202 [Xanthomonas phage vB_XciM_LucasX]